MRTLAATMIIVGLGGLGAARAEDYYTRAFDQWKKKCVEVAHNVADGAAVANSRELKAQLDEVLRLGEQLERLTKELSERLEKGETVKRRVDFLKNDWESAMRVYEQKVDVYSKNLAKHHEEWKARSDQHDKHEAELAALETQRPSSAPGNEGAVAAFNAKMDMLNANADRGNAWRDRLLAKDKEFDTQRDALLKEKADVVDKKYKEYAEAYEKLAQLAQVHKEQGATFAQVLHAANTGLGNLTGWSARSPKVARGPAESIPAALRLRERSSAFPIERDLRDAVADLPRPSVPPTADALSADAAADQTKGDQLMDQWRQKQAAAKLAYEKAWAEKQVANAQEQADQKKRAAEVATEQQQIADLLAGVRDQQAIKKKAAAATAAVETAQKNGKTPTPDQQKAAAAGAAITTGIEGTRGPKAAPPVAGTVAASPSTDTPPFVTRGGIQIGPMPTLEHLKAMQQAAQTPGYQGSRGGTLPGMDSSPVSGFPPPEEPPYKPPFKMTPNDSSAK